MTYPEKFLILNCWLQGGGGKEGKKGEGRERNEKEKMEKKKRAEIWLIKLSYF